MAGTFLELIRIGGSPQQMLAAITLVIAGGALLLSGALTLLGGYRTGTTILLAVLAAFVLTPFHSPVLLVGLVPFALGFATGKSTRVSLDLADPFHTVELAPQDYHVHQMRLLELKRSRQVSRFMLSSGAHPFEKLQLMMQLQFASMYRSTPLWTVGTSIAYVWFWAMANGPKSELSQAVTVAVLFMSLPYGTMMGRLFTYIRAHSLPLPDDDYVYSPTIRSFMTCIGEVAVVTAVCFAISALLPAAIFSPSMNRLALGGVVVIGLYRCQQTIFVHRAKLIVSPAGFLIWRAGRVYGTRWEDVQKATIRERRNWLRRTDRIVILDRHDGHRTNFVTSILSPASERAVLTAVRSYAAQTESVLDKGFY
jgi:hypothetical protein